MKRTVLSLVLAAALIFAAFSMASCGETQKADLSKASSLADLKGMKIAAQAGTFHADAAVQIEEVQFSTYPEFADLLTALKSGAIDGYIAEEPTAIGVCLEDSSLGYIHLKNNDTGFTATPDQVGIAVGLKKGSALTQQINTVLAGISTETRAALMEQMANMSAGNAVSSLAISSETPAQPNGTFKVGMECAYAPFNWTDMESGKTLNSVPISSIGGEGLYANGYDVQIAKYIADKLGMTLEIYAIEWNSLVPAVQAGTVDAIIAGMSPTADRAEQVDFTDTYYSSNLVVIYKK